MLNEKFPVKLAWTIHILIQVIHSQVRSEDGTLFLDVKCGSLLQQRVTRLQAEQAHEVARLVRQYIALQRDQRHSPGNATTAHSIELTRPKNQLTEAFSGLHAAFYCVKHFGF